MANVQPRYGKNGEIISYSVRVHRGRDRNGKQLKPFITTFEVSPNWSEAQALKKAQAFAAIFEKECREGRECVSRKTFEEYAEYVLELKEQRGVKTSTIERYRELTGRIYVHIGHMKLKDIKPQILNEFYTHLLTKDCNKRTGKPLSAKTVLEHHRFISTVLEQALKEGEVNFNAAKRADPPKVKKKTVNYFQPEEIEKMVEAVKNESLKHQALLHLFLITGARRGEIAGLKWRCIDFENNIITIENNVLYSSQKGVYETTLKTESSERDVAVPKETMDLLKQYKTWQEERIEYIGDYYVNQDYVFAQENGNAINPDSITDYFNKFSKKYGLKHANPHAFRHTVASLLYSAGADSVSISKRLGHAQVSTTANIYAHVIGGADKRNAELLSGFLK